MELQLVQTDFSKYIVFDRDRQVLVKFPNGYGASVVMFSGSYGYEQGLAELAVVIWESEDSFSLTYDTPITEKVLRFLTPEDINRYLNEILALPPLAIEAAV